MLGVFLINLPCGFWREGVRKFSFKWFLAVHAPIPAVVAMRLISGLGYQLWTFPVIIIAYFGGQFVGARIRRSRMQEASAAAAPASAAPASAVPASAVDATAADATAGVEAASDR